MKIHTTFKVLLVIILAELLTLIGVIMMTLSFQNCTRSYKDIVKKNEEQINIIFRIREDILSQTMNIQTILLQNDPEIKNKMKIEAQENELKIRKALINFGLSLKTDDLFDDSDSSSEKQRFFSGVNDSVLKYLNYNSVVLFLDGKKSQEDISEYIQNNITPEIINLKDKFASLLIFTDAENYQANKMLEANSKQSKFLCIFTIVVLIFSFILSSYYGYKNIWELETYKNGLELKSNYQNAMLELSKKQIVDIQNKTIVGVADLIENRSSETGEHVKRTSLLVGMIAERAKEMNKWPDIINDEYIELITQAAPLHDIGKILISDLILNKPGKLTSEEFETMKTHAKKGGEIVAKLFEGIESSRYIEIAYDIATYHHEKWDGAGYPANKKGLEIPLCARIMAVADVFDALVSERCYKKAIDFTEAFNIIENDAGKHFDPEVVEVLLSLKQEIINER